MAITAEPTVTINRVVYKMADLSEAAKKQLDCIRAADLEIERLENLLSMCKAARLGYGRALEKALPKVPREQLQ
jgi:hypothetical protein